MIHKEVAEKILVKTHILYSITFFSENRAVYEMTWKIMVEPDWSRMTLQYSARMRIAC